ncbi:hypothetical protein GCM10007423_27980 [Dyadobacter endophyticus]|uniref:Uncharacterized protein n=1 Tax=Dyadobacter endophyticus TaxID=1749036 RepID=A0ABQ1YSA2_9BACT|nr:hypothetical protein GCM10007423_27980 [Dyadobacter endophyticus]
MQFEVVATEVARVAAECEAPFDHFTINVGGNGKQVPRYGIARCGGNKYFRFRRYEIGRGPPCKE